MPRKARESLYSMGKNLKLADTISTSYEDARVDILVGNDYYLDIISSEKIQLQEGLYLLGSKLGWIMS